MARQHRDYSQPKELDAQEDAVFDRTVDRCVQMMRDGYEGKLIRERFGAAVFRAASAKLAGTKTYKTALGIYQLDRKIAPNVGPRFVTPESYRPRTSPRRRD